MEAASPQLRRPQRTPRTPPHDSMRYSPPHRGTGNGGKAVLPREHSLDTWGAFGSSPKTCNERRIPIEDDVPLLCTPTYP